jgi:hypothetical protein
MTILQSIEHTTLQAYPPSEHFTSIGHTSAPRPLGGKDFLPPSEQATSAAHISTLSPLGDLHLITKSSYGDKYVSGCNAQLSAQKCRTKKDSAFRRCLNLFYILIAFETILL